MGLRIGLTGGIGSGKSTVARGFAAHGATVIDADSVASSLTCAGGAAVTALVEIFGDDIVFTDGAIDRTKLRSRVFSDGLAKAKLEAVMHPMIQAAMEVEIDVAERCGTSLIVLDIPLLVESRYWRAKCARILVVDCEPETQISRVSARSALAETQIRQIIATQAERVERLQCADTVIYNDGLPLAALNEIIGGLASDILGNPKGFESTT